MKQDYLQGFAGELLGTFILVFFGCGAVAVTVLFSAHAGLFQVAMVWGIGVALAIYSTRHLSCAHLNPAVSLAMVAAGRMAPKKLPFYWLGQIIGAILAGALLYGIFSGAIVNFETAHNIVRGGADSVKTAMIFGEYFPNPSLPADVSVVTQPGAFLAEALGTFFLVTMIFFLTEGCNVGRPPSDIAPILIGLTVAAIISVLAPLTQAGLNPARDFGPRLVAYLAGWGRAAIPGPRGGFFTVYILGPLAGAAVSALLFSKVLQPLMEAKTNGCSCAQELERDSCGCEVEKREGVKSMVNVVRVLVFGTTPPCARCKQAEKEARLAAEKFPPGRVIVEKHDALGELGRKYQVMMTPTIIIAEKTAAVGKILNESELVELIGKEVEAKLCR
ncbi:MAG: MIP family channel protein [Firmicutes bacterium]|nr:MIP family channel protein [Bacillota bacterium]